VKITLSVPQIRRLALLASASVATGNRDHDLRDTLLEIVRGFDQRRHRTTVDYPATQTTLRRTGHKGV
jgi:hypothetical protein